MAPDTLTRPYPSNKFTTGAFFGAGLAMVALVARYTTPYMACATTVYIAMLYGLSQRHRNRVLHARVMGVSILTDIALVLTLEWQRSAIETVLGFTLTATQQTHVYTSTAATVLYIPVFWLGYRRLRWGASHHVRVTHRRLGVVAFLFRTVGFLTMFSMLEATPK